MKQRIEKARALLIQENLSALIIDAPIDLFYFTGLDLSLGRLVIDQSHVTLFVDGRYFEACKNQVSYPVILTKGFERETPFGLWWTFEKKRVGFDAQVTSFAEYEKLQTLNSDWIPLHSPIKKMREIKDEDELDKLKKAAILCSQGYDFVLTLLKEGITEIEVARQLEMFWIAKGADRLAFPPHIAFGASSSQPHYHPGDRKLRQGDLVLIDIGVVYHHYNSDMTRIVFYGSPHCDLAKIYHIVYEAQAKAITLCRPGIPIAAVDRAARHVIEEAGYSDYFLHGLGHGVGLEIHELPSLRALEQGPILQPGMVLTIEPGIYLPNLGGIRLEDTLLICEKGSYNLTQRPISSSPQSL